MMGMNALQPVLGPPFHVMGAHVTLRNRITGHARHSRGSVRCVACLFSGPRSPEQADAQAAGRSRTEWKSSVSRDDFEDPSWNYIPNNPKAREIDNDQRGPMGKSRPGVGTKGCENGASISCNGPDAAGRVCPAAGIVLMRSSLTGIPDVRATRCPRTDFIWAKRQYSL